MLVPSYGDCEICGGSLNGELIQESTCYCSKCGKEIVACANCRPCVCPDCGEIMKSAFEDAADKGIIF